MKTLFTLLALTLMSASLFGQANSIVGFWLTEDRDSQVEIYKKADGKFYGRVVWLEEPLNDTGRPKVDDQNPDKAMHNTPIIGLEVLKDFTYNDSKEEWAGGTIYDPKNGRTYTAYMTLDGNTLRMRGYVYGMRLLGRSSFWTKEQKQR
jgi:uncharacterized protein (DUF2147 family)